MEDEFYEDEYLDYDYFYGRYGEGSFDELSEPVYDEDYHMENVLFPWLDDPGIEE